MRRRSYNIYFFVVLLYGNELSDEMRMLCCGNILQNTHTNSKADWRKNKGTAFFRKQWYFKVVNE